MKRSKVDELIREAFKYSVLCVQCKRTVLDDDAATDWPAKGEIAICHRCLSRNWKDAQREKGKKKGKR